jgi:hypothetical protein
MTVKEQIQKALDAEDWYSVMQLAAEARKNAVNNEDFFGTKKEHISIFFGLGDIEESVLFSELLKTIGFEVFRGHHGNILKRVRKGEIKQNDKENRIAILTSSDSLKSRLEAIGFLCQEFRAISWGLYCITKNMPWEKIEDKFVIQNLETKEDYIIDTNIVKAISRDLKIKSVLDETN